MHCMFSELFSFSENIFQKKKYLEVLVIKFPLGMFFSPSIKVSKEFLLV